MGTKGERTRQQILDAAAALFASSGYSNVTMKDICERSGMSRGGLYRHYPDKASVFRELFGRMSEDSIDNVAAMIANDVPAVRILDELFEAAAREMQDTDASLSLAIYEYAVTEDGDFFRKLNEEGRSKWLRLIYYGMDRQEFNKVDAQAITDLILYAYQGVRMWSRIIDIGTDSTDRMLAGIRELIVNEGQNVNN